MTVEGTGDQSDRSESEIIKAEDEIAETEKDISRAEQEESIHQSQIRSMMFSGPLPPPDVLERYDSIVPEGADRLLSMVEKEQKHRLEMREKLVDCQVIDISSARKQTGRGQVFGLIIGLSIIFAGVLMTYWGYAIPGATVITGTVAGGVGVFVIGRKGAENDDALVPSGDSDLEE